MLCHPYFFRWKTLCSSLDKDEDGTMFPLLFVVFPSFFRKLCWQFTSISKQGCGIIGNQLHGVSRHFNILSKLYLTWCFDHIVLLLCFMIWKLFFLTEFFVRLMLDDLPSQLQCPLCLATPSSVKCKMEDLKEEFHILKVASYVLCHFCKLKSTMRFGKY